MKADVVSAVKYFKETKMKLWRLQGCPKCKGALFVGSDTYGHYLKHAAIAVGIRI
jgi:hypothetical protein